VTLIAAAAAEPGWTTDPGWAGMFREMELGALDAEQSPGCFARAASPRSSAANQRVHARPSLALDWRPRPARHPDCNRGHRDSARGATPYGNVSWSDSMRAWSRRWKPARTVRRITEPLLASMLESPRGARVRRRAQPVVVRPCTTAGAARRDEDTISYGLAQGATRRSHAKYRLRAWNT